MTDTKMNLKIAYVFLTVQCAYTHLKEPNTIGRSALSIILLQTTLLRLKPYLRSPGEYDTNTAQLF